MSKIHITNEMAESLEEFERNYLSRLDEVERYTAITDLNDLFEMYFEQGLNARSEQ